MNFADLKIEIFRDLRVFALSPIAENRNSEITESHQKPQNTEGPFHAFRMGRLEK